MAVSQNGWTVDTSGSKQTRTGVDGVVFPNGVLAGDVATVLLYVADRFHREVEPLKRGSCWGWFVKPIEGSATVSNHASGTAIDINADTHPMGVRGTFTGPKKARIHAILADCDGVVRWGGDYTGRPDEMHYEIHKDAAAVKALAAKIRNQEDDVSVADVRSGIAQMVDETANRSTSVGRQASEDLIAIMKGTVGPLLAPLTAALTAVLNDGDKAEILAAVEAARVDISNVDEAVAAKWGPDVPDRTVAAGLLDILGPARAARIAALLAA